MKARLLQFHTAIIPAALALLLLAGATTARASERPADTANADGDGLDPDLMTEEYDAHTDVYDVIVGRTPRHGNAWLAQRAAHLQPQAATDASAAVELIHTFRRLGKLDEARRAADALTASGRNDPAAPMAMLQLLVAEGRLGEARTLADDLAAATAGVAVAPGDAHWHERFVWLALDLAWMVQAEPDSAALLPIDQPLSEAGFAALMWYLQEPPFSPAAMLTLGDALRARGDLNLAVYAWIQAKLQDHPMPEAIDQRIDAVWQIWERSAAADSRRIMNPREQAMKEIPNELAASRDWIVKLWALEEDQLARGETMDDLGVSAVLLKRIGVLPRRPRNHTIRDAQILSVGGWILTIGWVSASLIVLAVVITLIRRRGSTAAPGFPAPDAPALPT